MRLIFFFICCTPFFFTGCSKDSYQKQEQSFRFQASADPTTFDPRMGRDLISLNISHQLFSSLFRVDRQGNIVNDLCSELLKDDEHNYTIRLKEAFWSDGKPVTSYDFRYSWLSTLAPNHLSPHASDLFIIQGAKEFHEGKGPESAVQIRIINETEFQLRLEAPCPYLKSLLATPGLACVPAYFDEHIASWKKPFSIPISGPYYVSEYIPKSKVTLSKNVNYHNAKEIIFDTIEMYIVDDATSLSMLERDDIDWIGSPLGGLIADSIPFLKRKGWLHMAPMAGCALLRINTTKEPLTNKHLRQSLYAAIDRSKIVHQILVEGYVEAYSLLPPCITHEEPLLQKRILPEKTLQWPSIEPLRLSYPNVSERHKKIAQVLQKNLEQELGISILLNPCDAQYFFQKVASLDYDIALGSLFADYMDPLSFFTVFYKKQNGSNNTGWESAQYQAVMNHLLYNEKSQPLYKELLNILIDEMPVVPIYYFHSLYGTKKDSQIVTPLGYFDFHKG